MDTHVFILIFRVQEPVLPGTFLRARAIGLMPMIDQVYQFGLDASVIGNSENLLGKTNGPHAPTRPTYRSNF